MKDLIDVSREDLVSRFPARPFGTRHTLAGHPLFEMEALVALARTLPRDQVEYNAGNLDPDVRPEDIPTLDMPPEEVLHRLESCNAWMVLKRVETVPPYRVLLEEALAGVAKRLGRRDARDAGFHDIQGFVFVSSANATTPFHFDPEENFFIQIRGPKLFHIFDNADRSLVAEEDLEMSPDRHRNIPYRPEFERKGQVFTLSPGQGLFVPHLMPHWVRTGDAVSVSMAITWKSPRAERLNALLRANALLRRLGVPPGRPGRHPGRDALKVAAYRSLRRAIEPLRRSEGLRRLLRGLLFGRKANYYYGEKQA